MSSMSIVKMHLPVSRAVVFDTVIHFYGHSFSVDYKPPNISPFRQQRVAQRKSEVNGKNCYLKLNI